MNLLKAGFPLTLLAMSALLIVAAPQARRHHAFSSAARRPNSWHGLTPLISSSTDVSAAFSAPQPAPGAETSGPYRVDGGQVTFSYITPNEAKIYHAPNSMVGKVFTIYFRPDPPLKGADSISTAGFKRCVDNMDVRYYYYVSRDGGMAYQVRKSTDQVEVVIYQPLHSEIRRLRVDTTCVF